MRIINVILLFVHFLMVILLLTACSDGSGHNPGGVTVGKGPGGTTSWGGQPSGTTGEVVIDLPESESPARQYLWTRLKASPVANHTGDYGVMFQGDALSIPPSRTYGVTWLSADGGCYLFGGVSRTNNPLGPVYFNDLWVWRNNRWTWIGGSEYPNQPTSSTSPGGRSEVQSWQMPDGSVRIYGGYGRGHNGQHGYLADMWLYNGNWQYMTGSTTPGMAPVYPDSEHPELETHPGSRRGAATWHYNGRMYLFGGEGYDVSGNIGKLNDLWYYAQNRWHYVGGPKTANSLYQSNYQYQAPSRIKGSWPGARSRSAFTVDHTGQPLLFGGHGYGSDGDQLGYLTDLWCYDGEEWIRVAGFTDIDLWGTMPWGDPTMIGNPGGRCDALLWCLPNSEMYVYGGYGWGATNNQQGLLADFWKVWCTDFYYINGPEQPAGFPEGEYSLEPDPHPSWRSASMNWRLPDGTLLIFGGNIHVPDCPNAETNDLWQLTIQ